MQVFLLLAVAASALAAIADLRTREIPNWLSLGALAVAPALHFTLGAVQAGALVGLREAGWSISGAAACGLVPFLFWRRGAFGGGDVKMMAAVGALLLPLDGIEAEFYALIAAAIFAPARLAWEGKLFRVLGNVLTMVTNPFRPKAKRRELTPELMTSLRFGPAIFAGALLDAFAHWRR